MPPDLPTHVGKQGGGLPTHVGKLAHAGLYLHAHASPLPWQKSRARARRQEAFRHLPCICMGGGMCI